MRTGIFGGLLTGSALSVLLLGGASVLTFEAAPPPDAGAVDVPAGSEFRQSRDDLQASLPAADDTPDPAAKPRIEAPVADDLASLDGPATEPASQPSTGAASAGLSAPDAPDAPSGVALDVEEPVLPAPPSLAPEAPVSEEDLSISTDPAQPLQPKIEEDSAFEEEDEAANAPDVTSEDAPDITAENTPDETPEVQTDITALQPAPDVEDSTSESSSEAADTVDAAPETETEVAPENATENAPETEPETEPETAPQIATDAATEPAAAPETEAEPAPSGTIGNIADGVTVGRLPSVADPDETEADAETAPTAEPDGSDADVTQDLEALPPLERYAAEFDNPDEKPLMSFILVDEGQSPIGFEALAEFPYPISYAVDVAWPGAPEAMAQYREAGLEVLAMVDLPAGAGATDTEVAMQTYLGRLPEAVAVMEGLGTGLQSNREATEQLIPILKESGHGLVLFSEGLDTAQKLIAREGVPALSVFRDIDSNGQTASVIRRFLDQAAFRAGQEEVGVIIIGRLRAETVSALLLWGLQDRASSVAIAPVSALLQRQVAE